MSPSPPDLPWHPVPPSNATCKVALIQAGGLYIPYSMTLLPGPDQPNDSITSNPSSKSFYAPDYVFHITHLPSGTTYIFDLGMRKDLQNLPPLLVENVLPNFKCEPESPADILKKYGTEEQQPKHVKAVIFSHMHFDHVGDGAKAGFHNAELWIGPTTCTYARPGYPVEERAPTLSETLPVDGSRRIVEAFVSDEDLRKAGDRRAGKVAEGMKKGKYEGVELKKVDWKKLGAFERAWDVCGDGSMWVVDAPGHVSGHQMLLVRTTPSSSSTSSSDEKVGGEEKDKATFILLAGDSFHHPIMLNNPLRTARPPYSKSSMHAEPELAIQTMWRVRKTAEREDCWVVGAHDFSVGEGILGKKGEGGKEILEGVMDISGWRERGWKRVLEEHV